MTQQPIGRAARAGVGPGRGVVPASARAYCILSFSLRWAVGRAARDDGKAADTVIAATNGKLAGWYLDAGAEAEKLQSDDGKPFRAREAVLVEKPKAVPRYYLYETSQ